MGSYPSAIQSFNVLHLRELGVRARFFPQRRDDSGPVLPSERVTQASRARLSSELSFLSVTAHALPATDARGGVYPGGVLQGGIGQGSTGRVHHPAIPCPATLPCPVHRLLPCPEYTSLGTALYLSRVLLARSETPVSLLVSRSGTHVSLLFNAGRPGPGCPESGKAARKREERGQENSQHVEEAGQNVDKAGRIGPGHHDYQ